MRKLLLLFVLLFPIRLWAQDPSVVNIIRNGDLEGNASENFIYRNLPIVYMTPADIVDGVGVDGSRGLKIETTAIQYENYDNEFWFHLNQPVSVGTRFKLTFDYRADNSARISLAAHCGLGGYIDDWFTTWVNFDTEWKSYTYEGSITSYISSDQTPFTSLSFHLNDFSEANNYYFDNIRFEVYLTDQCPKPTFTLNENLLSINSPFDATIYYTLDGSTPTTSSSVYTSPLVLNQNYTVKAIASVDGYETSSVATYQYKHMVNLINNSILEGSDVSNFFVKTGAGNINQAVITDGIGMYDDIRWYATRSIKVEATARESGYDDNQFFIRLNQPISAGTRYRVSFHYRADKRATAYYEAHSKPGECIYSYWGSVSFQPMWYYYSKEGTVYSSQSSDDKPLGSMALDLSTYAEANNYYFDNIKFEVYLDGQCPKPTFTVNDKTLSINSPFNATIYYTLDGSTPTTSSSVYTSPLVLNQNQTVKAIAVVDGYTASPVATYLFIVSTYDMNNDGLFDDDDVKILLDKILGRADGTDVLNNIYDANNDGKIDITDIVQLIGLSNDIKEGRLPDIDEENEGGFEDPTETELKIMQMLSNENDADKIKYAMADSLEYDALAKEVISKYNTDDDSDYDVTDINKTRASYDDLAKAAIRDNGENIFMDEKNNGGKPKLIIDHKTWNSKNWGNSRYGGFKTFYNTLKKDGKRNLLVVFYKEGGFPNKKIAYLKLGQLNSGKIIGSIPIYPGQEYAFIRVCIDDYIQDYGCFNVFPLLITEESKARNYRNPIFVQSDPFVDVDWREKHNGDEFGRINGVSVYCNTSPQKKNEGGKDYIYQCVELCKRYISELNSHINKNDLAGNAINWPAERSKDGRFIVYENDGRQHVREGDLIVWKHLDLGHIGVVIKTEADKIIVAHQNGGAGLLASPIGSEMKLVNGIIKDIAPGTNRSPIFGTIQSVPYFIRVNNVNEHITPYNASMKASTTNMAFSSAQVGKSITQTFIINNPKGMDKLEISSITLSRGDAFSVDVNNCSIEPGDAKVVRVTFTPPASGDYKDRIIIRSNADDNPTWAIHLSGSGKDN